jgi:ferredoxin--NADP+ reductase
LYEILEKRELAPQTHMLRIRAKEIARKAEPGQFVIFCIDEKAERIPITIADTDRKEGSITVLVQEVGTSTLKIGKLKTGDSILSLVGPLGVPTHIEEERIGNVVCMGGGFGIAALHPIAKKLKQKGNNVISIIGARSQNLLLMEKEMKEASTTLKVATDDGSYGQHGFVTDVLKGLIGEGINIDRIYAIGPVPMMRAVCNMTKPHHIKTYVSLNPIMVDGTGMCGGCRVTVKGETKFACVDGPDFDGHEVDFDELVQRQQIYKKDEELSHKITKENYPAHCVKENTP